MGRGGAGVRDAERPPSPAARPGAYFPRGFVRRKGGLHHHDAGRPAGVRLGKDALEGFINYPRSIVGVEVAVSFREEAEGVFRVSFRSKGRVDVSAVAARFGGGGHRNAAGCTVLGPSPTSGRGCSMRLRP